MTRRLITLAGDLFLLFIIGTVIAHAIEHAIEGRTAWSGLFFAVALLGAFIAHEDHRDHRP